MHILCNQGYNQAVMWQTNETTPADQSSNVEVIQLYLVC